MRDAAGRREPARLALQPPGCRQRRSLPAYRRRARFRFGSVRLSSSFLASCPLALSSALFIQQRAKPLTLTLMNSELRR